MIQSPYGNSLPLSSLSLPFLDQTFIQVTVAEGGLSWIYTPIKGNPINMYTGGTVFAGGKLQNNALFDNNFGVLNYPYQGIPNTYADNQPNTQFNGITKAISRGVFGALIQNKYVILTFNSELAGLSTNILISPGSFSSISENTAKPWVNTRQVNRGGGWYYVDGKVVNVEYSRDYIGASSKVDGRLTFLSGGKIPALQNTNQF